MSIRNIIAGFEPAECCGPLLVGVPLLSATAGASTVGLLGAGGVLGAGAGFGAAVGSAIAGLGGLSTLGTIVSIGSSLFSGMSQQQDYSGQIAANQYNARINQENAGIADAQTKAAVEQQKRDNYLRMGAATAAGGANGGIGGSTTDILGDLATQNELSILNIKYQGDLNKRSYLNDAGLDLMNANTTKKTARLSAGASLLSGTAALAGKKLGGNSII